MLEASQVRRCTDRGSFGGKKYAFEFLEPAVAGITPLIVLSERIEWFEIHWFGGRHVLCVVPPLVCSPCNHNVPRTPSGYFVAMHAETMARGMIRLTPRMLDEEPQLKLAKSIRGVHLNYYRVGNKPKGKKMVRVTGDTFNTSGLPVAPDVTSFVLRTFGVEPEKVREVYRS